jgi:anthranilate/para-aminobenzoate synthase component I
MLVTSSGTTLAGSRSRQRTSTQFMALERYSHVMHLVSGSRAS